VLDSLEDPQNVGTLLRSAEAAGVHGVIYPTHRQAPLTPAAIKASAGAVEHLLLCPVDDLPAALSDLRIHGLRIAAAEAEAPLTADEADLRGPLAIIVGSEGQGLSPAVRRRADVAIRIPMRGSIGSLNAAVAGSILLFAAVAQREPAQRVAQPGATDAKATSLEATEPPSDEPNTRSKPKPPAKPKVTTTSKAPAKPRATTSARPKTTTTEKTTAKPKTTTKATTVAPKRTRARGKDSTAAAEPAETVETEDLLPGGPDPDAADQAPDTQSEASPESPGSA